MNKRIVLIAGCLAILSAIGLAYAQGRSPLRVVPEVDLARYAGQWYEIARFPNRFQKRCAGEVTAQYTLQPSGKISVLNRCRLENGGQIQAEGVARVASKGQPNSILKVRFAPAFLSFIPQVWGDYQIIALSPDYTHALVGVRPGIIFGFCRDRPRWTMPHTINSSMKPKRRNSTSAGCRRRSSPDPNS